MEDEGTIGGHESQKIGAELVCSSVVCTVESRMGQSIKVVHRDATERDLPCLTRRAPLSWWGSTQPIILANGSD